MAEFNVRDAYRSLDLLQTHLIETTEAAKAAICPYYFRVVHYFGSSSGTGGFFLLGNVVHEALSTALPGPVIETWRQNLTDPEQILERIMKGASVEIETAVLRAKEEVEGNGEQSLSGLQEQAHNQFRGIMSGFASRVMARTAPPTRALPEFTITNVQNHSEGRLDAILEWPQGKYGVIDWKTSSSKAPQTRSFDYWEMILNCLLSNYRYRSNEDDWSGLTMAAVVYNGGTYFPRLPFPPDAISAVKQARNYSLDVLSGKGPPTRKPSFCAICDTYSACAEDCFFYREDLRQAREGTLRGDYDKLRRMFNRQRYLILEERAVTNKADFLIDMAVKSMGLSQALRELERYGVVDADFVLTETRGRFIRLQKQSGSAHFKVGKFVRVIGIEPGIPLLASVGVSGNVVEKKTDTLEVELWHPSAAIRAQQNLPGRQIVVVEDVLRLTRRLLAPIDYFHKLAGQMMSGDSST